MPSPVSEHGAPHYPLLCWLPSREFDIFARLLAPNVPGTVEGTASLMLEHTVYMDMASDCAFLLLHPLEAWWIKKKKKRLEWPSTNLL